MARAQAFTVYKGKQGATTSKQDVGRAIAEFLRPNSAAGEVTTWAAAAPTAPRCSKHLRIEQSPGASSTGITFDQAQQRRPHMLHIAIREVEMAIYPNGVSREVGYYPREWSRLSAPQTVIRATENRETVADRKFNGS